MYNSVHESCSSCMHLSHCLKKLCVLSISVTSRRMRNETSLEFTHVVHELVRHDRCVSIEIFWAIDGIFAYRKIIPPRMTDRIGEFGIDIHPKLSSPICALCYEYSRVYGHTCC